jgi:hypothetical protein
MRSVLLTIICLFVLSQASLSQSKEEKEVAIAVETLKKAMIDGAEPALKEIAAEELSYGHSSGKIENKAEFIRALVSGDSDFKTIELTEQTITIAGNAAIVRHKLVAETSDKGNPGNPKLWVLLIWQKQKGAWKLLARQAVRIPA